MTLQDNAAHISVERLASKEDLDGVLAIEDASFNNPTTRAWYEAELQRPEMAAEPEHRLRHESSILRKPERQHAELAQQHRDQRHADHRHADDRRQWRADQRTGDDQRRRRGHATGEETGNERQEW